MADRNTILYRYSLDEARHIGEVSKWRESHVANLECASAIEEAIKRDFQDNKLDENCAKSIIEAFGFDRTNFILKCTIRNAKNDGRYSEENRNWASIGRIAESNIRSQYTINAHPTIIDGLATQARKEWDNLHLYDASHIDTSDEASNYEGKILVLRPDRLLDAYKDPKYQLFLATGGFGCSPTAIGRTVSGNFLFDDEFATFNRTDFYGAIDEKFLPEWVTDNIVESQSDDISMT